MLGKNLSNSSGAIQPTYVDDVFSAYTYTGNGSTQTITNGIDLAGKGGMVWVKDRSQIAQHNLFDTVRGVGNVLSSNSTVPQATGYPYTVQSTGFTANHGQINTNAVTYASWTFRKAPKFFDVVTYTGTGTYKTVSHSLGVAPGMIIIKATSQAGDWYVYHRSLGSFDGLILNTAAATASGGLPITNVSATSFDVLGPSSGSIGGVTYVAYIFAHDASTDGIIQCGTFTTNGSGNATASLGWEPQFVMTKLSSTTGDWRINDSMRKLSVTSGADLRPNLSQAEADYGAASYVTPTANGFSVNSLFGTNQTVVYLAIRRPNKPPTVGTQVYTSKIWNGTGTTTTLTGVGFSPDLVISQGIGAYASVGKFNDRLRGTEFLDDTIAAAVAILTGYDIQSYLPDGIGLGSYVYASNIQNIAASNDIWFFKRAPGVFDVVCYTGTGVAKTEAHGLGAAAEFWIVKSRTGAVAWAVGCTAIANTEYLVLNTTAAKASGPTVWNSTYPTASVFSIGASSFCNNSSSDTYVAYLFATKAGISKVGSYTGNGSSQTINCGFTTGARFILIKRTDSTGDWFVFDTRRGIVAGNDPHQSLNTTSGGVATDDSIDPDTSGFIVNQVAATNINVTSATYIYLAFA